MANNLYFCNVKNIVRHEVAASGQRFLCQIGRIIKRIEWGCSNVPKGSAQCTLTTRNALSFINV